MVQIVDKIVANEIDEISKGYITGFFDAEGMVRIAKDGTLSVGINQAYKPVLERFNKLFRTPSGIKVHSKEGYDKRGVHSKGAWSWKLSSDNAVPFLEHVHTYSIEKRKQIDLVLRYQKEIRKSHKENRSGCNFRLSDIEIEQRNWFIAELERLQTEKYNEKVQKNYDNEIKKLRIPKAVRDGTQMSIIPLDELYKSYGIDTIAGTDVEIENCIPEMSNNAKLGYYAGYVSVSKGKRDSFQLRTAVMNSNFKILRFYEEIYGGKIRLKSDKDPNHKQLYLWELQNNDSMQFLKAVHNYTIVKKSQVYLGIKFQEFHNEVGIIRTPEQKHKANWYCDTIKKLKKETGESDITYIEYVEPVVEKVKNLFDY